MQVPRLDCDRPNPAQSTAQISIETSYSWLVALASLMITSLSFGAVTSIPILMNPMIDDLGWSRSTVGMAHALAMIAAGLAGFWLGRIADRRSFAWLSLVAGVSIGLGLWLTSTAYSPWRLYLPYALLVGAIGQGAFFGPITATASHWFDRNQALAMALVMCGQSVGGLAVPVVLRVAAEGWGWRNAMMGYGLLCTAAIVICSLVFIRRPPTRTGQPKHTRMPIFGCSKEQGQIFGRIVAPLMLCNAGSFILLAHLVAMGEEFGLTPLHASALLSTMLGVTIISRLVGGLLVDFSFFQSVLYLSTLMIPLGGVTLFIYAGDFFSMMIGVILVGLGYGGVFPVYTSLVRSVFPSAAAATWISALFMFAFFAAAGGSWLGGFLRDIAGNYGLAITVSILLTTMSLIIARMFLAGVLSADQSQDSSGDGSGHRS